MDMTLAVIAEIAGLAAADAVAAGCEYVWNRDPDWDPFAARYGLTAPGDLS
jgi:hypothetical protein